MKKMFGVLIFILVYSNVNAGKMYKWIDKDGQAHYSQTAPLDLGQNDKVESIALKAEKKGDSQCCLTVRKIINKMLVDIGKGGSLGDLQKKYSSYHVNLTELENFVSYKARIGLDYLQISQQGYDTCLNAKFNFCRTDGNDFIKKPVNNSEKTSPKNSVKKPVKSSSGSGFFVSQDGYIITNEHVAGNCKSISVQSQEVEAILIDKDSKYDLALLKVVFPSEEYSTFRESEPVLGEQVITAGFPYKGLLSSGIKITSGIVSSLAGMRNDSRLIQITAPIQPGNSGGPLIDSYGNVIGVIVSKLNSTFMLKTFQDIPQNVNFAINGEYVKEFLERNYVDFRQSNTKQKHELTEISQLAKNFTVEVSCLND